MKMPSLPEPCAWLVSDPSHAAPYVTDRKEDADEARSAGWAVVDLVPADQLRACMEAVREECARLCEDQEVRLLGSFYSEHDNRFLGAKACAAAIRSKD